MSDFRMAFEFLFFLAACCMPGLSIMLFWGLKRWPKWLRIAVGIVVGLLAGVLVLIVMTALFPDKRTW